MAVTLQLAWRNLWRNPRRTWLTASAIAFITLLMVFLITLQLGSYDLMVDSSLRIYTGHMQVQREGYADKPQIRKTIPDARALARRLRAHPALAHVGVAVRAQGFALAASSTRSYGVQVVGIEPQEEARVSTLPHLIKSGRYLSGLDAQEVVLGTALARNLNIKVGDELVLLGSGVDGSVAATALPVVGLFESGMPELDRKFAEMPLGTFQQIFGLGQDAHTIALLTPDIKQLPLLQQVVTQLLPPQRALVVLDWGQLIPGLKQLIQADWTTGWFSYMALIIVVTFSILNTFLMTVLERTREFGVMLALGATPLRIGMTVFLETTLLTLIGLTIGIVLGSAVALYFSFYGFTYPGLEELMGQYGLPGLIYPKLSATSILLGPAVILCCVLLVAVFPALRIRRLEAVQAIHAA
jgi:ABC-type lipoprotein release transport system permease subunit